MRVRAAVLIVASAAALAAPAAASADIPIAVPARFLGGPVAPVLALDQPLPPAGSGPAPGRPSRSPATVKDPCAGEPASDCVVLGPGAQTDAPPYPEIGPELGPEPPPEEPDTPEDPAAPGGANGSFALAPAVPVAAPAAHEWRTSFGGLSAPRPAAWLPWQTPTLRWRATPGASYYNVQVFRGARRVVNAWPTAPRLVLPRGALEQGRTYVWAVWPAAGPRARASYGPEVGRSLFGVTLRPRLVLHRPGSGRLLAETRPHIPRAVLRLSGPAVRAGRVPGRAITDAAGRLRLGVARAAADRLRARLVSPGPLPPVGLRGRTS